MIDDIKVYLDEWHEDWVHRVIDWSPSSDQILEFEVMMHNLPDHIESLYSMFNELLRRAKWVQAGCYSSNADFVRAVDNFPLSHKKRDPRYRTLWTWLLE